MGRAGEMPKMVKGHSAKGSMRPQAEMRERPTRNRNRPVAGDARAQPVELQLLSGLLDGRQLEGQKQHQGEVHGQGAEGDAETAELHDDAQEQRQEGDRPEAAPMQPKASTRFCMVVNGRKRTPRGS